jgi:hypothetical protein
MAGENHPVPKDRSKLIGGQWFPYVLSKINLIRIARLSQKQNVGIYFVGQ